MSGDQIEMVSEVDMMTAEGDCFPVAADVLGLHMQRDPDTQQQFIDSLLAERDAAVARADELEAAIGNGDDIEWSVSLSVLRELAVRYPSWAADLAICEGLLRRIKAATDRKDGPT